MSQPAIFPYMIGLEDYVGMELEDVIVKFAEDNKQRITDFISVHGYPLSYNGEKDHYGKLVKKVGEHAKTFEGHLKYNWSKNDLTDMQKEALSFIYDYSLDNNNDGFLRSAAERIIIKAQNSREATLG